MEFDATLGAGCEFWKHLYSLREVEFIQDCSKTSKVGIEKFKTSYHTKL